MGTNTTTQKSREPVDVRAMEPAVSNQIAAAIAVAAKSEGISAADSPSIDAFGRWRVAEPQNVFDAQFTYDLQPLIYEAVTAESGAAVTHDADNRAALMTFASTPDGGKAFMQTYDHFRYQPGKSQAVDITFNFIEAAPGAVKFAGYCDGVNGIQFLQYVGANYIEILSDTDQGDESIYQSFWNLDTLDGTGGSANPSGILLDLTKTQILVIDFQALYVGRVRVGFNIDGITYYAHEFLHANRAIYGYIQTANLPIRVGMLAITAGDPVSSTMHYYCCSVISEGGQDDTTGYPVSTTVNLSAGSGARTHAISLRPKTTFNSIANRSKFVLDNVEIAVIGSNPVRWELCIGQAISGTTTFADVNTAYSGMQINTAGALSGGPALVVRRGTVPSSAQSKSGISANVALRLPITLDAAGAVRLLGTLSVVVTGVGGASSVDVTLNWKEIR